MDIDEALAVYNETGFDPFYYFTRETTEINEKREYILSLCASLPDVSLIKYFLK
jgi:hypothetical protein